MIAMKWLYGYEQKYNEWKEENFSDQEYVDISWMHTFDILLIVIFITYVITQAVGGSLCNILHTLVVLSSFSYIFYKALFYESPYPKDFYYQDGSESMKNLYDISTVDLTDVLNRTTTSNEVHTEQSFTKQIPNYITILKEWMETEKPYLYSDFKLSDVARVLPLNRSYLSRVFNEGFQANFSTVVRSYRVEYSKKLIKEHPSMSLYKVAELSGFHSDSSFFKAFKLVTNLTPSQFKAGL